MTFGIWSGSPNECQTFGRPNFGQMLYARMKQNLLLVSTLSGQEISW